MLVSNGVVYLLGSVCAPWERDAINVAAENHRECGKSAIRWNTSTEA